MSSFIFQTSQEESQPNKQSDWSPPVEISIEDAEAKIPFELKQPSVPFQVDQKTARVLDTNGTFDAVEITYENTDEGLTLILMMTNSKADTPPNGKKDYN